MTRARLVRGLLLVVLAVAMCRIGGCDRGATPAATARIRVLTAASLADAFRAIGAAFEAEHPGIRVEFSFAGSNQLRTQLEQGGPGDVFASADRKQMDAAIASRVVDPESVRLFAHNLLAIVVPRLNRAEISELGDLARPGVSVVVADPSVPVGTYTRLMLERAGATTAFGQDFVRRFEKNIVSLEANVAAVVAKVALDQVDAGIAYASDAAGGHRERVQTIALPEELAERADYLAAVTVRAAEAGHAERFVAFLASEKAQALLVSRGFTGPAVEPP